MSATTVRAPGCNPIGAAELQANSRRYFRRALTLSGAVHVAFLATLLALQARDRNAEPAWNMDPIHLLPSPPRIDNAVVAFERDAASPSERPPKPTGIPKPVPDFQVKVPNARAIPPVDVGREIGRKGEGVPVATPSHPGEEAVARDPGETEIVLFDVAPKPTYNPIPEYPEWARDAGIQGRVILHVLVGRDGRVKRVTIMKDVMGLGETARVTVSRWLFRPALSGGKAVPVWVELPVEFRL